VGNPMEPPTRADAVHRSDHGLPHVLVPRREVHVEVLDRFLVATHAEAVAGDLADVDTGLERPALAGMDDDPYLRIVLELRPGVGELVSHLGVHRVEPVGTVVDQPADMAVTLHHEMLVSNCRHCSAPGLMITRSLRGAREAPSSRPSRSRCAGG